jgi:uncharacterized cupredoxin-like copper-binding protein
MKKAITIVVVGILPVAALASGDHTGPHETYGEHHMERDTRHMEGATHEAHGADANAGRPGDRDSVSRDIKVVMDDTMRFSPSKIHVKAGETVRFIVTNKGTINHEMVIGSMDELEEHAQVMRSNPTMHHTEANMVTVAPGQSGEIVWQFGRPAKLSFACLVPGHLEAGMIGEIDVE